MDELLREVGERPLIDPKIRSPWAFLVEGKFQGLDELAEDAKKSGRFDYDRRIPGLEVVDRYTIRFRLKAVDYNLPYVLAHEPTAAVAREVIEAYGADIVAAVSRPDPAAASTAARAAVPS